MNYIVLEPNEAIFTDANTVHAYLYGDILECMANSDNVIRAGMTPKFKDINSLLRLVDYKMSSGKIIRPKISKHKDTSLAFYKTSCSEFDVSILNISGTEKIPNKNKTCMLFLCIEGKCILSHENEKVPLSPGLACFVSANTSQLNIISDINSKLAKVEVPQ